MAEHVSTTAAEALRASHASEESIYIGPVVRPERPEVVFYQLNRKFVDEDNAPADDKVSDIMYYTLAVGHHTGIIDCFDERCRCSAGAYARACDLLLPESDARRKLENVLIRGEIQVDKGDLDMLEEPVTAALAQARELGWKNGAQEVLEYLSGALSAIRKDGAVYLMVRLRLP